MDPLYFGIDVAKKKLDLATASKHLGVFSNDREGHRRLIQTLHQHAAREGRAPFVALEASGGYERSPLKALLGAGVTAAMVQPGCVRHLAKAGKVHAKNDVIDAKIIARYAEAFKPRPAIKADPTEEKLRDLNDRRQQVIEDRTREGCRLEQCPDPKIRRRINTHVKQLRKEESRLDQEMADLIEASDSLRERAEKLTEIKGVGPQAVRTLFAHMPELGRLNRRQVAALAGLAPYDRDSGGSHRKRSIFAGRAKVRKVLYMCAVSCSRHNPVLKVMYDRLVAAGKRKMVALIAITRKLLTHLNGLMARHLDTERCLGAPGRYA